MAVSREVLSGEAVSAARIGQDFFDHELQAAFAAELVDVEAIREADLARLGVGPAFDVEGDRFELQFGGGCDAKHHAQMLFLEHVLLAQDEAAIKNGFREVLAPRPGETQQLGDFQSEPFGFERTVAEHDGAELPWRKLPGGFGSESGAKLFQLAGFEAEASGHGVAAEATDQARVAIGDVFEGVANVEAADRTRRTLQFRTRSIGSGRGEDDCRPMPAFLDSRRDDSDHSLMPLGVEQAESGGDRFAGIACIPNHDIEAAVIEIERVAKRGAVRGLEIANTLDMKPLYHRHWEPLWAAVDASELPVHIHTIGGKLPETEGLTHLEQRAAFATFITGFQLKMADKLMEAIYGGVLERFPRVRLVIGEAGIGWIPYVLEHMNLEWEDQFQDLDLTMRPSEYWHRQCHATYQSDPIGVRLIDVLGEDNVMWGSDFPHPDGVWPDSQEFIAREMAGVDARVQRKVLWENAARLYGFPAEPTLERGAATDAMAAD